MPGRVYGCFFDDMVGVDARHQIGLGQLVFENDRFYYRILHNETAFAIQRRLQFAGLQAIVLPIRVLEPRRSLRKAS